LLLFANVASEKQARCPQVAEETDIAIQLGETTINVEDIKKKLK
jgi:predicted secreted acid phosphatase